MFIVRTEVVGKVRNGLTVGVIVINAQSAAYVDMFHKDVTGFELILQLVDTVAKRNEIPHIENLRTDVEMKADKLHVLHAQSHVDHLIHIVHADAEFVFGQPGSDIGMGMRTDIGVDAESNVGYFALGSGQFVDDFQFRNRLDVETENIVIESQVDLPISFAYTGKDDLPGRKTGFDGSTDFTSADTVGTQSAFADDGQYLGIGIGLDGIVYTEVVVTSRLTHASVSRSTFVS